MADFKGRWKDQWDARIAFFCKEAGKTEEKNKGKEWSNPFWKTFFKKKKKGAAAVSEAFGKVDAIFWDIHKTNIKRKPITKKMVQNYTERVNKAERLAKEHLKNVESTADTLMPKTEMTKQELVAKERDIKRLLAILKKDIEALTSVAQSDVLRKKDILAGVAHKNFAFEGTMRKLDDSIKKAAPWIAKLERKPDVRAFNSGISPDYARDLSAYVGEMRRKYRNGTPDHKILSSFLVIINEFGTMRIDERDRPDKVIVQIGRAKKLIVALKKWMKTAEAPL